MWWKRNRTKSVLQPCVDGNNVAYAPMIAMRAMKLDFVDRVVPRMRRVGVA